MGPTKNKAQAVAGRGKSKTGVPEPVATVEAKGEVDRAGIEACDYLLSQAADQVMNAVLDLSDATYFDYRAAPILVARRRFLKARGGELAIAAGRAEVRNILRAVAGSEIPVFVTMEEAMAYVRGEADLVGATVGQQVRKSKAVKR
jgi:anti-anti-sigma factor